MKVVELDRDGSSPQCWPELHEEIARLPQRYREPVVLCDLEGLTTDEASLRIGCPKGTVLSRLSRARERLRGRLDRRGLGLPAVGLVARLTPTVRAALPARLLETTVQASLGFVGRLPAEATLASTTAIILARGVLNVMTISKLAILGAAGLAGVFAIGHAQTFGWFGVLEGAQEPVRLISRNDDPQDALTRSLDKLESELDETALRNTEMRKELQDIRARLKTLREAPELAAAKAALAQLADKLNNHPTQAVARFAHESSTPPVSTSSW